MKLQILLILTFCFLMFGCVTKEEPTIEEKDALSLDECEDFSFDENKANINNFIYSLNTPSSYKKSIDIEIDKQRLFISTLCLLAQDNENKSIDLYDIVQNLLEKNITMNTKDTEKIKFPTYIE